MSRYLALAALVDKKKNNFGRVIDRFQCSFYFLQVTSKVRIAFVLIFSLMVISNQGAVSADQQIANLFEKYEPWLKKYTPKDMLRYSTHFRSCDGCLAYVAFCKSLIMSSESFRGLNVRTRDRTSVQDFFSTLTGVAPKTTRPEDVRKALQNGQLDCVGFGGEKLASPFTKETFENVAKSLGADSNLTSDLNRWRFARALQGDGDSILSMFHVYDQASDVGSNISKSQDMAAYWIVRAYEFGSRSTSIKAHYEPMLDVYHGRCTGDGRLGLCKGVQKELKRIGQYLGAIDGKIGPGTRAAIELIVNSRSPGNSDEMLTFTEFQANGKYSNDFPKELTDAGSDFLNDDLDDF